MVSFNFLRTGHYNRSGGNINGHTTSGNWWSTTAGLSMDGHYLNTYSTNVLPQDNYSRGFGFAVLVTSLSLVKSVNAFGAKWCIV